MTRDCIYDDPLIMNMERTGYPDGKVSDRPRCPICGAECDTIYERRKWEIVGCDECIQTRDAWDVDECF